MAAESTVREYSRYADVRAAAAAPAPAATPHIWVPRLGRAQTLTEVFWRALRDGTLKQYIAREKARLGGQIRAIARARFGQRPNPRSDLRRRFTVPARLYFRWLDQDPHYWDDPANLKSLKRDNPELLIDP